MTKECAVLAAVYMYLIAFATAEKTAHLDRSGVVVSSSTITPDVDAARAGTDSDRRHVAT